MHIDTCADGNVLHLEEANLNRKVHCLFILSIRIPHGFALLPGLAIMPTTAWFIHQSTSDMKIIDMWPKMT